MRRVFVVCLAAFSLVACAGLQPSARGIDWDGAWSGIGDQAGVTYPVEITISGSAHAIDYPTIPCGGTLTLVNDAGDRRELDESITTGVGTCADGGRVVLVRSGDQMSFEWFFQGAAQRSVTGTLTHQ